LSYLEGKTNEEVAALLQWPVGTVKGRLSRARDLLRSRLTRRGLVLSATFLTVAMSQGRVFAEVVPAELIRKTVRMALVYGPHAAPPDPDPDPLEPQSPSDQPAACHGHSAADPQLRAGAQAQAATERGTPRLARIGLISTLVLVIAASLGYATCM